MLRERRAERALADIVLDAEHEVRRHLLDVARADVERLIESDHVCGPEFPSVVRVAAASNEADGVLAHAEAASLHESGKSLAVERTAGVQELWRAIEGHNNFRRLGDGVAEELDAERPEEANSDKANAAVLAVNKRVDDVFKSEAGRAHDDDDNIGGRVAEVLEAVVTAASLPVEQVEGLLDTIRDRVEDSTLGLNYLHVDLASETDVRGDRAISVHGVLAPPLGKLVLAEEVLDVCIVLEDLDRLELVGDTISLEEMAEGGLDIRSSRVGNQRHVVALLDVAAGQGAHVRAFDCVDVRMICSERGGCHPDGARGDVQDEGDALASHVVEVRDHEEDPLRRAEGRREGACGRCSVARANGSKLRPGLADSDDVSEDVLLALRGVLLDHLGHDRGRGDGEDGREVDQLVHHHGRRSRAVDAQLLLGGQGGRHILILWPLKCLDHRRLSFKLSYPFGPCSRPWGHQTFR